MYFSSSHTSNTQKRGAQEELVESPRRKKLKLHGSDTTTVSPQVAKSLPAQSIVQDIVPAATPKSADVSPSIKVSKKSKIATKGSALENSKKKSSTMKLKPPPKEDKEDAYIAYLESKLGINKGGNKKRKATEEDGLDGTLQCSPIPYLDLEKSYWLRSHGLGGFVCGTSYRSKFYAWFVNTIY